VAKIDATLVQQVLDIAKRESGNRMYIITARRRISGLVLMGWMPPPGGIAT
jgi:hypothetical protein